MSSDESRGQKADQDLITGLLDEIRLQTQATEALTIEKRRLVEIEQLVLEEISKAVRAETRREAHQRHLNEMIGELIYDLKNDILPILRTHNELMRKLLEQTPLSAAFEESAQEQANHLEGLVMAVNGLLQFNYLLLPLLAGRDSRESAIGVEVIQGAVASLNRQHYLSFIRGLEKETEESLKRQLTTLTRNLNAAQEKIAKFGGFPQLSDLAEVQELEIKIEYIKERLDVQ